MRMPLIEIRDTGKETPGPQRNSLPKTCRLHIGFFDADGVVVRQRQIEPAEEEWVDIGAQVDFRFAKRESARQSLRVRAESKSGDFYGGRIMVGCDEEAIQHSGDTRIECVSG